MASHSGALVKACSTMATGPWYSWASSSMTLWFSPKKITPLKKSPYSIGEIAKKPMMTEGMASRISGRVTTSGDSCGFWPGARP